ncbi:MAG: hypothetical protein MZU91_11810, partial [Desulfosudis oleivorans]|nr:hypothetical protein [Desulfosudis oleivorans]
SYFVQLRIAKVNLVTRTQDQHLFYRDSLSPPAGLKYYHDKAYPDRQPMRGPGDRDARPFCRDRGRVFGLGGQGGRLDDRQHAG